AVWRVIGSSPPDTGTVPATGASGRAYGLMFRWCRIVANHPTLCTTVSGSQAHRSASAAAATPNLRLPTTHLLRAGVPQQRLDLGGLVRSGRHEDAKAIVREAWIVLDGPRAARRERRVEENAQNRGQRAEQDRHLEHDDDVRRDRSDRLAAHLNR